MTRAPSALLFAILGASVMVAVPVSAAPQPEGGGAIVVSSPLDVVDAGDGEISLREAITLANAAGNDEITLADATTYQLTLGCGNDPEDLNAGGDLDHTDGDGLLIRSSGRSTIEQTCDGERVLESLSADADITIEGTRFTGGDVRTETLVDATGGGIRSVGWVFLTESSVFGNQAAQGGGVFADGAVFLTDSEVAGNSATQWAAGILSNDFGGIALDRSTVAGNTAPTRAGLSAPNGRVQVVNSTVTLNTSTAGSATRSVVYAGDSMKVLYSLVAGNTTGVDLNVDSLESSGSAVGSCVVAHGVVSGGYNLQRAASCGLSGTTNRTFAGNLGLGPLRDNGGPTRTRLPSASSPLAQKIPGDACVPNVDQRYVLRPGNGRCEIGPVEIQFRPDGLVRWGNTAFVGAGVYGPASAQTSTATRFRGQEARFTVKAVNNGEVTDRLRIRGPRTSSRFLIRYFAGTREITSAVTGSGYLLNGVVPGAGGSVQVRITPTTTAFVGDHITASMVVASAIAGTADRAGARVDVIHR